MLILGIFWHAATQFSIDRARRAWKKRFREEQTRREAAEAANRAKALFLTNMSHEMRAPLNAIAAFTEMALRTPLNPELREYLSTVQVSGDWLGHVVKEILDFSRMEAGAFHLCISQFSIREIARSAVKIAQPLADQKKLSLRLQLGASLPSLVQGDGARLLQVMFNLVENALKFTSSGGVMVSVALLEAEADVANLRISIADTGMGIPAEQLAHLFEPLATPVASLDKRTRTCGFGLPICQRVVHMMGGEIEVFSRPGVGSTFTFALELPIVAEQQPLQTLSPFQNELQRPIKVLMIDSYVDGRLATVVLQGAGHLVTEASNGMEALRRFTMGDFDLILMDVEMPDLTCVEAARAIRATEPEGRRTPVYLLATTVSEADKERWFQAGFTGFLQKPLLAEVLLELASAIGVLKHQAAHPATSRNSPQSKPSRGSKTQEGNADHDIRLLTLSPGI